jgi:plasmid stabilization system protein ParE
MRSLVFRVLARSEIVEAARWYEGQASGLGADFLRAVEIAIAAIQRNPYQYQQVHGATRRARLRRFPHGIVYYISGADEIVIVGCVHGRRDPEHWQDRA